MSGSTFPGRGGAESNPFGNSNPFGASSGANAGAIGSVIEEDETDTVNSPTTGTFGQAGSLFGTDGSFGGPPSSFKPTGPAEGFPNNYGMGRRTSVSAESLTPNTHSDNWTPPHHQKTDEQNGIIQSALHTHTLFSGLAEEQSELLMHAMTVKDLPAKDIKIITQGDQGDYFYVVGQGSFDVYVSGSGKAEAGANGMGTKVATIQKGGSFGELALLYGHPRNATVITAEPNCRVFAIDRATFRRIIMNDSFARRRMYEDFLLSVDILKTLQSSERAKIADVLETEKYEAGQTIIKEGDVGTAFYLLESGEAEAYKEGVPTAVKSYKMGDYFGELALLNDAPRAASVICKTECKVARLGKAPFQRLLGPVEAIMRRTKYDTEDIDPLSTS